MTGLRIVTGQEVIPMTPCIRCQAEGCPWDRIADKPICPDCQERIAMGESAPIAERLDKAHFCAICGSQGTVRYLTYPLHLSEPLEIDLCADHLQGLLYRRLDRQAFLRLSEQLDDVGVQSQQIFLLHNAFYDGSGLPLQPVAEMW